MMRMRKVASTTTNKWYSTATTITTLWLLYVLCMGGFNNIINNGSHYHINHAFTLTAVMVQAVDHSKFRTCDQTRFCHRYRRNHNNNNNNGQPKNKYQSIQYKLLHETIEFHYHHLNKSKDNNNNNESTKEKEDENNIHNKNNNKNTNSNKNVWSSLSRRLFGQNSNKDDEHNMNIKNTGTSILPTVTGRLQQFIPSSTTTMKDSNAIQQMQQLEWSIIVLQNGIFHMRITEVDDKDVVDVDDTSLLPRVTYDDLILQQEYTIQPLYATMNENENYALFFLRGSDIKNNKEKKEDSTTPTNYYTLLEQVIQEQQGGSNTKDLDSYIALVYHHDIGTKSSTTGTASKQEQMFVLIQMEPTFVVTMYRMNNDSKSIVTTPILQMNGNQMMHYEIRQRKQSKKDENGIKKESDAETTSDSDHDRHNGKEIVGYWEDGLAIYADGTREEKTVEPDNVEEDEEHRRLSEEDNDDTSDGEEHFGSHVDTHPHGSMSVGMDIDFLSTSHLYGIPEHASSTVLRTTTANNGNVEDETSYYKEPYRLYNLDVFEYELNETMALYGAIPIMISQSITTGTTGVYYNNPTETFIDISRQSSGNSKDQYTTHWISESGIIDIYILPGPTPHAVYEQYAILTGTTPTPPMFALGYHQCRWNYRDEDDVFTVNGKFEELDYPYDVLWLDIEHTDGKRYFTWDANLFPKPKEMIEAVAKTGRNMVTIIDPHIKRDDAYYIHKEATQKGLYIKNKDGTSDYDGWCWPGSSSYLDFTAAHVRSWWADQFAYNKYIGSTPNLFTWNDMNEPSVFNGPEVSMSKDLRNLAGVEHREWHNLYGMLFHRATMEGQIRRNQPNEDIRPFVLSRAFFAGTQRYGAIWTGDNAAEWSHLQIAAPMLLSLNIGALSFVGADVGGFFGNPDAELFTRWMQAGAYQPFFRGHAHHDSKRREPWMFDEETLVRLRTAAMARYALLPYWYTTFYEAEMTGMPVMRMMWMEYPQTEALFGVEDQYLIGSDLLIKPITTENTHEVDVIFPTDHLWYDVISLQSVVAKKNILKNNIETKLVPADIDTIPVYQRGGSIVTRKLRLRRSSQLMKHDPYTLYVALDENTKATGKLHMDDENTFGYKKRSEYADSIFSTNMHENIVLENTVHIGAGWEVTKSLLALDRMIERIIIMGVEADQVPTKLVVSYVPTTTSVVATDDNNKSITTRVLDFTYDRNTKILVIRKPEVSAMNEWTITTHSK